MQNLNFPYWFLSRIGISSDKVKLDTLFYIIQTTETLKIKQGCQGKYHSFFFLLSLLDAKGSVLLLPSSRCIVPTSYLHFGSKQVQNTKRPTLGHWHTARGEIFWCTDEITIGSDVTSHNDMQSSWNRITPAFEWKKCDWFLFCFRVVSAGREVMSAGFPPREQLSERPELADTCQCLCTKDRLSVTCMCVWRQSVH